MYALRLVFRTTTVYWDYSVQPEFQRGMGHGGHANTGKVKRGNKVPRAPIYPPKAHGAEILFPDERFVAIALYQRTDPRYW